MINTYNKCRISDSENLIPFLKGEIPLAGGFLKSEAEFADDKNYPLTLAFCPDSGLVQVNEVISGDILFKNYFYKTGSIKTLADHFQRMAVELVSDKSKGTFKILEIGCNDFSMLKHLVGTQFTTIIGVDPSDVSAKNTVDGVELLNTFFTDELAKEVVTKYGKMNYICASNCFAHIENIRDVAKGISTALALDGTAMIEVHWLGNLIGNMQFPMVYHEHQYYYSLKSISYLLNQFGLEVYRAEHIPIHGGSIRYYVGHKDLHSIEESVNRLQSQEVRLGLYNKETFTSFDEKIQDLKNQTMDLLERLHNAGARVYGYGASGQANTLMSLYGIKKEHIPLIIDDAPLKIGCFTPDNHIPIVSSEILKTNAPEFIFVFAYTFYNEIRNKNDFLKSRWIVPLPQLEIH